MTRRTRLRLLFPLSHVGTTVAIAPDSETAIYYCGFASLDGESTVVLAVGEPFARQSARAWLGETDRQAATRIAEVSARAIILADAAHRVRDTEPAE